MSVTLHRRINSSQIHLTLSYSVLLWDCRPSALWKTFLASLTLWELFYLERVLLCAFIMNRALGPIFLFCCKFLFEMEFLKRPYLSKGFCIRKPILIRLCFSPDTLLLSLFLCYFKISSSLCTKNLS